MTGRLTTTMCCESLEQEVRLTGHAMHGCSSRSPSYWSGRRGDKAIVRGVGKFDGAGGAFGGTGLHILSGWRGWWVAWPEGVGRAWAVGVHRPWEA